MAFDFKKEYKEFYLPARRPAIVTVPRANYVAVRGKGDPNAEDSGYQQAVGVLYAVAYTLKMSGRAGHSIPGFFDYVVPPLEGFWWQPGVNGVHLSDKGSFHWISAIRLPDFVTAAALDWAIETASAKKRLDCSAAAFWTVDEGLCVQCMHLGAYDDEPATVASMDAYARAQGYLSDLSDSRLHHEIYLADPRRTPPEKRRTVLRQPVRPAT